MSGSSLVGFSVGPFILSLLKICCTKATKTNLAALVLVILAVVFSSMSFFAVVPPPLECEIPRVEKKSFALVLPHVDSLVNQMKANLDTWKRYPPCQPGYSRDVTITLYFYQPNIFAPSIEKVWKYWELLDASIQSCFDGGIGFIDTSRVRAGTAGRRRQFFELFEALQSKADVFFVLEPDASPVQKWWLDALAEESQGACDNFWARGSLPRCDESCDVTVRSHSYANAIFCTSDDAFADFRRRVEKFHVGPEEMGCSSERGDHVFYQFLKHSSNYEYARTIIHKFQYTPTVKHLCEENVSNGISEASDLSPDTYIVHAFKGTFRATLKYVFLLEE